MISTSDVLSAWSDAEKIIEDVGIVGQKPDQKEMETITNSLNAYYKILFAERSDVYTPIIKEHLADILVGAYVAKGQMDAEIDGMFPKSSKLGVVPIRAAYLGIGKDWDDAAPFKTGEIVNWIHSGTTFLGGTVGNPIQIGRNQVTVIFAFGVMTPEMHFESLKLSLNGDERPIIELDLAKLGDVPVVDFDGAILLKRGTTLKATLYATDHYGTEIADVPYFMGVSFIPEDILRLQDPTTIPGQVHDVVLTT